MPKMPLNVKKPGNTSGVAGTKSKTPAVQSSKKKSAPKLKCILADPFEQKYWPKLHADDVAALQRLIEDDKTTRMQSSTDGDSTKFDCRSYLQQNGMHLGLTACLRKLKSGSVAAVFLSTEIRPHFIISRIINYILARYDAVDDDDAAPESPSLEGDAVQRPKFQTKIFLVDGLGEMTLRLFGFSSNALTLISTVVESSGKFDRFVQNLFEKFPIPRNILQYYSTIRVTSKENKISETKKMQKNCRKPSNYSSKTQFDNIYLIKTNNNTNDLLFRVDGTPAYSPVIVDSNKMFTGDYISFSDREQRTSMASKPSTDKKIPVKIAKDVRDLHAIVQNSIQMRNKPEANDALQPTLNTPMETDSDDHSAVDVATETKPSSSIGVSNKKKVVLPPINRDNCRNNKKAKSDISYKSMIVHKIQPNPNKKKKQKKKNKNKV